MPEVMSRKINFTNDYFKIVVSELFSGNFFDSFLNNLPHPCVTGRENMVVVGKHNFFDLSFVTLGIPSGWDKDKNQYNQNNGREPRMWVVCLINEMFGMMLISSGTFFGQEVNLNIFLFLSLVL